MIISSPSLSSSRIPGLQPRLAIHKRAVETADIFDRDLAAVDADQRMLARDLGFGIVGVQVDLGKRAGVRIPSPNQIVARFELEFLTRGPRG